MEGKVRDMSYYTSGNLEVDAIGRMNITGDVIPANWYKTVLMDKGVVDAYAVMILADIVYWYRPVEVRDERTGQLVGYKKKFHGDKLQRSYDQISDRLNITKNQAVRAIKTLTDLGVVIKEFRTEEFGGRKVNNIMYLSLDVDRLKYLTFYNPDSETAMELETEAMAAETKAMAAEKSAMELETGAIGLKTDPIQLKQTPIQFKSDRVSNLNAIDSPIQIRETPKAELDTNTENTTESINGDYLINPILSISTHEEMTDGMDETKAYMDYIRSNLELDVMLQAMNSSDRETYEEMYNLICDIVCVPRKTVRISGEDYPYEIVKSRFLKLKFQHLEYVALAMKEQTTRIGNIKAYMLTALYNAPNTLNNYYQQRVAHDLYGKKVYLAQTEPD